MARHNRTRDTAARANSRTELPATFLVPQRMLTDAGVKKLTRDARGDRDCSGRPRAPGRARTSEMPILSKRRSRSREWILLNGRQRR